MTGEEEQPTGRELLSDFQKVKLTHFFSHVLDMNHDDVISAEDFVALNQVCSLVSQMSMGGGLGLETL